MLVQSDHLAAPIAVRVVDQPIQIPDRNPLWELAIRRKNSGEPASVWFVDPRVAGGPHTASFQLRGGIETRDCKAMATDSVALMAGQLATSNYLEYIPFRASSSGWFPGHSGGGRPSRQLTPISAGGNQLTLLARARLVFRRVFLGLLSVGFSVAAFVVSHSNRARWQ